MRLYDPTEGEALYEGKVSITYRTENHLISIGKFKWCFKIRILL